jgi:hypothetical protein
MVDTTRWVGRHALSNYPLQQYSTSGSAIIISISFDYLPSDPHIERPLSTPDLGPVSKRKDEVVGAFGDRFHGRARGGGCPRRQAHAADWSANGNAPAKPGPALDDKKAQEQTRKRPLNPPVSGQQINTDPKASSRFEKDLRDPVEVM